MMLRIGWGGKIIIFRKNIHLKIYKVYSILFKSEILL